MLHHRMSLLYRIRNMTVRGKTIDTKQIITLTSAVLTAWLLYSGIVNTDGFLMSFANSGVIHTGLRAAVLVGLLIVLFSRPPRSTAVRMGLGALSSIVLMGACVSMMDYHIGILDAVLYLQVSIILAMEAIEDQKAPVRFSQTQTTN